MTPVTLPGGVNPYLDAEIRKMALAIQSEWRAEALRAACLAAVGRSP